MYMKMTFRSSRTVAYKSAIFGSQLWLPRVLVQMHCLILARYLRGVFRLNKYILVTYPVCLLFSGKNYIFVAYPALSLIKNMVSPTASRYPLFSHRTLDPHTHRMHTPEVFHITEIIPALLLGMLVAVISVPSCLVIRSTKVHMESLIFMVENLQVKVTNSMKIQQPLPKRKRKKFTKKWIQQKTRLWTNVGPWRVLFHRNIWGK